MAINLGVDPKAVVKTLRLLKLANGLCLELFEYGAPDQNDDVPKNSDIGGHHIAFYVDDINQTVKELAEHGVEVQGEPKLMNEGLNEGFSWVYALAPWGLQLEFVSYPEGMKSLRDRTLLFGSQHDSAFGGSNEFGKHS